MKKVFHKKKLSDILFWLAYIPWLVAWVLTSTHLKDLFHPYAIIRYWQIIGSFLLCISLLIKRRLKLSYIILMISIVAVAAVVSIDNGNASFVFYSILLVIMGANTDFDEIVYNTMWLQITLCGLTVILSLLGIIPNDVSLSNAGGFYRERYSLGFLYTTYFPNYLLSVLIEFYYLKRESKWDFLSLIIFAILNIVSYKYTMTRLSYGMIWMILLLSLLKRYRYPIRAIEIMKRCFYRYSFLICAGIALLLTALYDSQNRWLKMLNDLLSQRLRFGQNGLMLWGVSLFGASVEWNTDASSYNYVDSSYVNILICYGVIIFLFVVIGFTITQAKTSKNRNETLCVCLSIWAVRGIVDPQLFLIWFNPFMFLIGRTLLNDMTGGRYVKPNLRLQ